MPLEYIKLPLSGGGGGSVLSVNGQTGVVVLTAPDIGGGGNNLFTLFDATGFLTSQNYFQYKPVDFYGINWFHNVELNGTTDYNTLHLIGSNYNAPLPDSKQSWNQIYMGAYLGSNNNGNQLGDPIDIKSTLVVQDITYTSRRYGMDGDVITIEYIGGGTAGSEVVTSPSSFEYVIQIEDGVSTATQILAAIEASSNPGDIKGTLDRAITGTGSNPQSIFPQTNLAGGENANGGINMLPIYIQNTSNCDMGYGYGVSVDYNLGNNTDPIDCNRMRAYGGNMIIHDNVVVNYASAFEFGFGSGNVANSKFMGDLRGINIYGNPQYIQYGVLGFQLGLNINTAQYVNAFQNTINCNGNITNSVNSFADFSNYSGDIGDNYYGVAIQPNLNTTDGFFGINISPNVTASRFNSTGVNVYMGNVGLFPGVKASVTVQDLFLEAAVAGSGINSFSVTYVSDVIAGSEYAVVAGNLITVHIDSGVSTALQVQTALLANITILSNISVTVSGVGSNPQVTQSPVPFAGGVDGGSKNAAQFNQGNVNIYEGKFQSNYTIDTATQILDFVYGMNSLGGNFHVQSGHPVDQGQFGILNQLAVSMQIEDNVLPDSTGFNLGTSMNGFLTQIGVSAGKTMDALNFMAAGASIPQGSGSLTNLAFYRVIGLIPQGGSLSVTNIYGFKVEPLLTATSPTNAWGVWIGDTNADNWFAKNVVIGGATGHPTGSYALDVIGDVVINGIIHDTATNESIDSNNRHLILNGYNVADWNDLKLRDAGGDDSLRWGSRELITTAGATSVDWENRELKDTGNATNVDFKTTLNVKTGVQFQTATKSADYTIDTDGTFNHQLLVDTSGGPVTITLGALDIGRQIIIKDSTGSFSVNNLTIDAGGNMIDGVVGTTTYATNYDCIRLTTDGTNYFRV